MRRIYHHVRAFGVMKGSLTAARCLRRSIRPATLNVPGYRAPISLRMGTSDVYTLEKVLVEGEYADSELSDPRCIIDAGANIGCSAIYFAERYPDAAIIAVEPDFTNYALLLDNTESYANIHPVQAALWHESTTLTIENPTGSTDSFIVTKVRAVEAAPEVRAVTVDELLVDFGFPKVDLIKIDIESAEKELFEGSVDSAWLGGVDVIMIELHDRLKLGCSSAFYRAISRFEFSQQCFGEVVVVRMFKP